MIALKKTAIKGLLIMYKDRNLQKCYLIIVGFSVNYKKQVMIIDNKSDMQCLICKILFNKYQNLCKK